MKTIIIEATVGEVYAPKSINVFIDNKDNSSYDKYFESQKSFKQSFEATSGRYVINIVGTNQIDDKTTISVGGDFVLAESKESSDENYVMVFISNVN